jgi:two-component system response regulator RegX3
MSNKLRVLIIEDEEAIASGLAELFVYHGFEVDIAADGKTGLNQALTNRYDLLVLDIMLPQVDGFAICSAVRQASKELPIIILTAKDSEQDTVHGFKLGADDYIAKPFSIEELMLRVRAVLRRSRKGCAIENSLVIEKVLEIDTRNLTGRRLVPGPSASQVQFTRREIEILAYLKAHSDRPVPRAELLSEIWGYHKANQVQTRTVDIHIAKLRRKIETDPDTPRHLITVRGEGYKLVEAGADYAQSC